MNKAPFFYADLKQPEILEVEFSNCFCKRFVSKIRFFHVFKLLFYNSRARFTAFSTKWTVFFRDISDKTVVVVT